MKTIQSVPIWSNGTVKDAQVLNAYCVNLTLGQSATFYYSLATLDGETLAQGNLTMDGADYQGWSQDTFAWDWIANQLNLTIIED